MSDSSPEDRRTDAPRTAEVEASLHRVMGPGLLLLFIVGDILGTGIYALTGQVAKQVGGVVWLPFLVAFAVALITAFSYLELVTKYPKAAGAALYTHKAFGIHFVTFLVAFAVMCSGITSASTASRAFAANMSNAFGLNLAGGIGITLVGLAFFAMVGFEDSVNMAEECKDPVRNFPRVLLLGLFITGAIYVLVSISAITLVPPEALGEGETPLLKVVAAGAPNFPLGIFGFITMFAVANSALINMLMASRLVYGMSREGVLPRILGAVHPTRRTPYVAIAFTSLLAFGLITFVGGVPQLGGTTALLLLCVFTVVNVAVLVLRRDPVAHAHFRTPTFLPIVGAAACAFLVGPWTGRDPSQYRIAGVLL